MPAKAVIDTNVWVSYFINNRINYLVKWLLYHDVEVFVSDELLNELEEVLQRPKFIKRKSRDDISDFIHLLHQVCTSRKVKSVFKNSPDPDDNFLFDLCITLEADYLITSDKKLLRFTAAFELSILTFPEFRELFAK